MHVLVLLSKLTIHVEGVCLFGATGGGLHPNVAPSYTHFPVDSSKSGFTGSVLGPAMLGINTAGEQNLKAPTAGLPNLGE